MSKVGADDFIVATGAAATMLDRLPREDLGELFEEAPGPLSPAQDFRDGHLFLGWTTSRYEEDATRGGKQRTTRVKTIHLVSSGGAVFAGEARQGGVVELQCLAAPNGSTDPVSVLVKDRGFRTRDEGTAWAKAYLQGEREGTLPLLEALRALIARRVVFPHPRSSLIVALWVMGTYLYKVFETYPYLWVRSPTKRCGKSRLLDTLARLAFNARHRLTRPTEAFLIRAPELDGGTQLIDESDNLQGDRDAWQALVAVLNHGYTRGGMVPRVKRDTGEVEEFEVYCPKAIAGLKTLAETLEDRSIPILLQRKRRGEGERMRGAALEAAARPLRSRLRMWALEHAAAVADIYSADEPAALLAGLDDRAADLWEPLVSLALLADGAGQGEGTVTRELLTLARELAGLRDEAEAETTIPALVVALRGLVETTGRTRFTPMELLEALKQEDELAWLSSPKGMATLLTPLGLASRTIRFPDGRRTRGYELDSELLADLVARYSRVEGDDP